MMQRLQGLQGLDRAMAMGIASYAGVSLVYSAVPKGKKEQHHHEGDAHAAAGPAHDAHDAHAQHVAAAALVLDTHAAPAGAHAAQVQPGSILQQLNAINARLTTIEKALGV